MSQNESALRQRRPDLPDEKALRRRAIRSVYLTLILLSTLAAAALIAVC